MCSVAYLLGKSLQSDSESIRTIPSFFAPIPGLDVNFPVPGNPYCVLLERWLHQQVAALLKGLAYHRDDRHLEVGILLSIRA